MNRNTFFFGAAIAASAFLSVGVGCGSDGGTTGGSGGSGGNPTSSSSSTTSSSTSSSTSASSGSMVTLDCATYCGEVMTNCTAANAQYTDMAGCMGSCAAFQPGTLADMSGNTLGCRIYHGGAAASDATTHCSHAGPTGGDKDPTDTAGGPCGEGCDAFCDIAIKACAGQTGTYTDKAECMAECKTFKADAASYSTADTGTNDFGCRMYHLTVASSSAANAMTHCSHIRANSPVCTQ